MVILEEDAIVEWIGAISLLLAALFFFITYMHDKRGNDFKFFKVKKNIFFLLLAILFFLGFGEEISWGQRLLGIETPEKIRDINVQNEITIHNLVFFQGRNHLDGNRLLTYFWFGFCCFIPVLYNYVKKIAKFLDKVNLPIVPLLLGAVFFLNYLLSKISQLLTSENLLHELVELKETNYSFLFLMLSIWFFQSSRNKLPINRLSVE